MKDRPESPLLTAAYRIVAVIIPPVAVIVEQMVSPLYVGAYVFSKSLKGTAWKIVGAILYLVIMVPITIGIGLWFIGARYNLYL